MEIWRGRLGGHRERPERKGTYRRGARVRREGADRERDERENDG